MFYSLADFFYNTDAFMAENTAVGDFGVLPFQYPSRYRKSWF